MLEAISNTSPLVYLYRIGVIDWLPRLFNEVWIPTAVSDELNEGQRKGTVWGTLKVLLEAKMQGMTDRVAPYITHLGESGMWLSDEIRERILALAGESISRK